LPLRDRVEIVLSDGAHKPEEPAIVAPHDLRECRASSLPDESDELKIGLRVGLGGESFFHHHAD
jgi:hypothetical protein